MSGSQVGLSGILQRSESAPTGLEGSAPFADLSPSSRHIGMAERPGPGYDLTSTGLKALRLPTQAAEAHVAEFARSCALARQNTARLQRRALPQRLERSRRDKELFALYKQSHAGKSAAAKSMSIKTCFPFQELLSAPLAAKYYALHQREKTRILRSAEQRSR